MSLNKRLSKPPSTSRMSSHWNGGAFGADKGALTAAGPKNVTYAISSTQLVPIKRITSITALLSKAYAFKFSTIHLNLYVLLYCLKYI